MIGVLSLLFVVWVAVSFFLLSFFVSSWCWFRCLLFVAGVVCFLVCCWCRCLFLVVVCILMSWCWCRCSLFGVGVVSLLFVIGYVVCSFCLSLYCCLDAAVVVRYLLLVLFV